MTQIAFDAAKLHPARVIDALGNETAARFDHRANKLASLTDANGATITNRYDPLGRLESVVDPGADEALPTTRKGTPWDDASGPEPDLQLIVRADGKPIR